MLRPQSALRQKQGEQRNAEYTEAAQAFVDHGMQGVTPANASGQVPLALIGQLGFGGKCQGNGAQQQGGQQP